MNPRNIDVSGLPNHAFGPRSALWWGTMGFIAIEATLFGVLISTYLYGMARADEWPLEVDPPQWIWGVLVTGLLIASLIPNRFYQHAAERREMGPARRWLVVAIVLEVAVLVVRALEFTALEVRWDTNFYGSILWTLLGFHTLHLLSDLVESGALLAMTVRHRAVPHLFRDLHENAIYWYFVIIIWIPLFVLVYVVPHLAG